MKDCKSTEPNFLQSPSQTFDKPLKTYTQDQTKMNPFLLMQGLKSISKLELHSLDSYLFISPRSIQTFKTK